MNIFPQSSYSKQITIFTSGHTSTTPSALINTISPLMLQSWHVACGNGDIIWNEPATTFCPNETVGLHFFLCNIYIGRYFTCKMILPKQTFCSSFMVFSTTHNSLILTQPYKRTHVFQTSKWNIDNVSTSIYHPLHQPQPQLCLSPLLLPLVVNYCGCWTNSLRHVCVRKTDMGQRKENENRRIVWKLASGSGRERERESNWF